MDIDPDTLSLACHSVAAAHLLLDVYIDSYFRWDLPPQHRADADELMRLLSRELETAQSSLSQLMSAL